MYNFQLINIDPYECSLDELQKEIDRLTSVKEEYFNTEQSIKIFINSIYGGLASPWFEGYNIAIAEAVTLQGQDIAQFASRVINDYIFNMWHLDKEVHEKLNLTYVNKVNGLTNTIYMDTDSVYVTFEHIIKSCDTKLNPVDFILKLKEYRLNSYLKQKFEEYAASFNTKNLQDLELEKISYSALMVAKKKYSLDLAWKDPGVFFKPQEKIKTVGLETQQGSTPKFVKKALKELIKMIHEKSKNLKYAEAVQRLKEYKKDFVLQYPEDLAKQQSIGDYEKYVLEDKKGIKLASKAQANVQSAAVYNYMLQNSKFKSKYNLIKTGDKIKWYYSKDTDYEVFGFLPNNYPYEFAPQVDYDKQFERVLVDPFNRCIEAMGYNPIPGNLIYARSLF